MPETLRIQGADELVTGEAVALELPAATVGLRAASGLLDVVVATALLVVGFLVGVAAVSNTDAALADVAMVMVPVLALVAFPTAVETLTRGRSLGKLALGLRTVRDDAGPITFRHAFVRALVGFVEIWAFSGAPALVSALASSKGKRLGDHAAGTYVVRDRFAFPAVRPAMMPHQLRDWASAADVAPLPDGLTLATRQLLDRAPSLHPASRARLGTDLLAQVLGHVVPPPPSGHHPEAVLAAVLAERRLRDERRLAREAALRQRLTARRGSR